MAQCISSGPLRFSESEQINQARLFYQLCNRRRTVRQFSDKRVARQLLEHLIRTAGTAPLGSKRATVEKGDILLHSFGFTIERRISHGLISLCFSTFFSLGLLTASNTT
ncbi:MAG TPA: hypothetical protein VNN76_11865 [Bacteroidota bacterium]|nr:hypothetical protein [Bacteroidota bacterium]